jgi:hypothetical protein
MVRQTPPHPDRHHDLDHGRFTRHAGKDAALVGATARRDQDAWSVLVGRSRAVLLTGHLTLEAGGCGVRERDDAPAAVLPSRGELRPVSQLTAHGKRLALAAQSQTLSRLRRRVPGGLLAQATTEEGAR